MRKGYLFITSLLVTLIGLLLPACRAKKQIPQNEPRDDGEPADVVSPVEPGRIRVLYGVPPEVYQRMHNSDSTNSDDSTPNNSTRASETSSSR